MGINDYFNNLTAADIWGKPGSHASIIRDKDGKVLGTVIDIGLASEYQACKTPLEREEFMLKHKLIK